jgi:RNA ligase
MKLYSLVNTETLEQYVLEGLVDVRHHPSLPLRLYVHSRRCTLESIWDDTTENCRGLIVDAQDNVVSRPFRKFFNVNTTWRPETMVNNLPPELPTISEKLDGSLGILYSCNGETGIATKGSFMSEQAIWATNFYRKYHKTAVWPEGYTPVFEIICESVQHHVVHYNGYERLVLLALIRTDTGEELNQRSLRLWSSCNGIPYAEEYNKSVANTLFEDRYNTEGYVLSWRRPGQSPLKVKVKHPSFIALQKVVHAATPRAILDHLKAGNTDLLDTWIGQTDVYLGKWVQEWVAKFNGVYGDIALASRFAVGVVSCKETRKEQAALIHGQAGLLKWVRPSVAFSMLDKKDHAKAIWKAVEQHFEKELGKPFALEIEY